MLTKKTRINKSRSRNGCLTCRQRHIKCDEAVPVCKNCRRSNRPCERGCRFNFLKSITVTPEVPEGTDYTLLRFMDQSLSIHKLYRCNNFHDYTSWLKYHTREEMKKSDADIRAGERAQETPNKRAKPHRSTSTHTNNSNNENSDSETSRQSSGTSTPFNVIEFISKILSFPPPLDGDRAMFIFDHREPLVGLLGGVPPIPVIDDKLTLLEFANLFDRLEGYALDDFEGQDLFRVEYSVLIKSLTLCVKDGLIDLFNETFLSRKVLSGLLECLNVVNWSSSPKKLAQFEEVHDYGTMMNFYELMLMDLNDSLRYDKPNSLRTDDEAMSFMFEKVLALNLFDDLNYFLIRITKILMKLNNLRHYRYGNLHELAHIMKDLKDFENNQFFSAFYPQIQDDNSFSSASSTGSAGMRKGPLSLHHARMEYANTKTRRVHIYYNFTICYILKHFPLTTHLRGMLYAPTLLNTFWVHQEADVFQRLAQMSLEVDFASDPFMSFFTRYRSKDAG